jgi:hypothetical protein
MNISNDNCNDDSNNLKYYNLSKESKDFPDKDCGNPNTNNDDKFKTNGRQKFKSVRNLNFNYNYYENNIS